MELLEIKQHWENWSNKFKTDLRATTKTSTIKKLEIAALSRALNKTHFLKTDNLNILEVGCGNGYNCYALAELFQAYHFTGVDYIPSMIENAKEIQNANLEKYSKIHFYTGDILNLDMHQNLQKKYHIVFTDRCIINLNNNELQLKAIDQLIDKVEKNGYLIVLENFIQTFSKQNECRTKVGLPERKASEFNYFMDMDKLLSHVKQCMQLIHIDDFGSLHDIVLYVLIPMINDGKIDYNHELVQAATDLSISLSNQSNNPFGNFGQNRLLLLRKVY